MIVAVIFLSLALLVVVGFALHYAYKRFRLSFEQEEKVAALEGQALVLSLREKLTYEFLTEMKRSPSQT